MLEVKVGTAYSAESGWMADMTTNVGNSEQTTFDVELVGSAGMLLTDHNHFLITAMGSNCFSLTITHSLDVHPMKRRLQVFSRLIRTITCRETAPQVQQSTQAMVRLAIFDSEIRFRDSTRVKRRESKVRYSHS